MYFRSVYNIAESAATSANAYVFLGYENNTAGTIGIAWVRSTCSIRGYRTSMSEWFRSDAVTAVVSFPRLIDGDVK